MEAQAEKRDQQREERRAEAAKHEALMKATFAKEAQATADAAVIYEEGSGRELPLPEPAAEVTETLVTTSFAPEAIMRFGEGHVVVVDPASFTRPGGAYLDGAFGPEQILCAESNLYQVLCALKEDYYDQNRDYRRGMLFSDRALFLPDVVFLRGGTPKKADVIAVAEPQRVRALENHRSERECDVALTQRVETLLRIAAANECETLVIGAFACGRLGYDPQQVITLLQDWIAAHPGAIPRIVFAVPRAFADAFRSAFEKAPDPEATPTNTEPEEDEEDWRTIDLPEGITLR